MRREVYETIAEVYRADGRLPELTARLERTGARDADELRLLASLVRGIGTHRRGARHVPQGARAGTRGHRDAAQGGELARGAGLARSGGARVRGADPRGSAQSRIRLSSRVGPAPARRTSASARRARTPRSALRSRRRRRSRRSSTSTRGSARSRRAWRCSSAWRRRAARIPSTWSSSARATGSRATRRRRSRRGSAFGTSAADRAQALLVLGEVYLNHDLVKEALETLSEAVKLDPKQWRLKKAYAVGLERAGGNATSADVKRGHLDAAMQIWEQLLRDPSSQPDAQREARQHLVTLWSLRGQLNQRVSGLTKRFAAKPPDLEAGRLVAEAAIAHAALRRRGASAAPTDRARPDRRCRAHRARTGARARAQARRRHRRARTARRARAETRARALPAHGRIRRRALP